MTEINQTALEELVRTAMGSGAVYFAKHASELAKSADASVTDFFTDWAQQFLAIRTDLVEDLVQAPLSYTFPTTDVDEVAQDITMLECQKIVIRHGVLFAVTGGTTDLGFLLADGTRAVAVSAETRQRLPNDIALAAKRLMEHTAAAADQPL